MNIGSKEVFQPSAQQNISFLDYAISKNGSYFDTGVCIHQRSDSFEIKVRIADVSKFSPTPAAGSYYGVFGARNNYIYQLRIGDMTSAKPLGSWEFYDGSGHYCINTGEWIVIRVDINNHYVMFGDHVEGVESNRNVKLNNTAWFGNVNMTGMSWMVQPAIFDCAYLKLYTNNNWSHDYRPAIINNQTVGFYELNSKTFHPSEGNAPFLAGPYAKENT